MPSRCRRAGRSGPSGPRRPRWIMCASRPAPAITANRSPLIFPTSSLRSRPFRPISTAFSMSDGISRLEANRFAVPAGMIASVTPLPASRSIERCTIPSPPQTKTSSAPSSSTRSTRSGAYLLFGTSDQIGSSTPACSSVARSSSSPPPIVLPAWAITATFFTMLILPWWWRHAALRRRRLHGKQRQ